MFNRNNTALIALFIFTVISFQTLSHAQLNSVTAGSTSDLENNCHTKHLQIYKFNLEVFGMTMLTMLILHWHLL